MKRVIDERWSEKEIEHHSFDATPLVCRACGALGLTKRDTALHKCAACAKHQGRAHYTPQDLNNKQQKEKTVTRLHSFA